MANDTTGRLRPGRDLAVRLGGGHLSGLVIASCVIGNKRVRLPVLFRLVWGLTKGQQRAPVMMRTPPTCPRATRSTTRRTGSGRCWRATCRTRSARRTGASRATAGRSGSAGRAVRARRRARQAPDDPLRGRADDPQPPADDRLVAGAPARRAVAAAPAAGVAGASGAATARSIQFDGPVLELMTDSRTRLDQRIAGLGPGRGQPGAVRRARLPAAAARGRPDAPDRRHAARPAGRRRDGDGVALARRAGARRSTRGGRRRRSPTTRRCCCAPACGR